MPPSEHLYHATVSWKEKKKGVIAFHDEQTPPIEVAVAPEFFGHRHIASPEELFVASVASCHMAYFLGVAEKMRVKFEEYTCQATGILSPAGMDYVFTSIDLDIVIAISEERHRHKTERALALAHKGCFVAHSIRPEVRMHATINVTNT